MLTYIVINQIIVYLMTYKNISWKIKKITIIIKLFLLFFSYIIKLSYLKKIYCILNLLDSTNLEHLMKESLKYKNTYISSIYKNIIDTLNSTQDPNTKTCYLFRRKIIGPYTASVLVQK